MKQKIYTAIVISISLLFFGCKQERTPLQIIFTNDSHSQVEPLKGRGGFEARAAVIDSLRNDNPNTILLDAGDMFQGSPYFNFYNGRVEVEAYNLMRYDAATLGNHEFDLGIDTLAARIKEMNYKIVCCNYDVQGTALEGLISPYTIIEKDGWRIGILGLSVNPSGLISPNNIKGVTYNNPIEAAEKYADILRKKEKCNLIIALSHLGLFSTDSPDSICDKTLIETGKADIDIILGGHTHSEHGVYKFANLKGDSILVAQEVKSGLNIYSITVK